MSHQPSPPPVSLRCHQGWEGMPGTAQVRFCDRCQLHVHNLSEMSGPERDRFIHQKHGPACIRYELRADGTMRVPSRWSALSRWIERMIWQVLRTLADYIGRRRQARIQP